MNKNLIIGILALALCWLALLQLKTCNKVADKTALIDAITDTLHKERNAKGQEIASIKTIYTTQVSDLTNLANSKDSTLNWLKKTVASQKKVIAAAVVSNNTTNSGVSPTEISFHTNYSKNSSSSPIYRTSWNDEWSRGFIKATADSVYRHFTVFNKFELKNYQSGGLFKKEVVTSSILNLNPHTETTELRTFQIQCTCNKGLYFGLGNIVGGAAMYFISR